MKINIEEIINILTFLQEYISKRKYEEEGELQQNLIQSESIFPIIITILIASKEFGEYVKVFLSLS